MNYIQTKNFITFLLICIFPIISCIGQNVQFDVEGLTKLRGRIDIGTVVDTTTIIIGRNAGVNIEYPQANVYNTFVGYAVGRSNSGLFNSFFGSLAGESSTTGNYNSFFGTSAGRRNTIGMVNSFFGEGSGSNNTIGERNSFFGRYAGNKNTTGDGNTFMGYLAGWTNKTGKENVTLGSSAASGDSSMNQSTYIGFESGFYSLFGSISRTGNVFLGYRSGKGEDQSNRLYIENSDADSSQALIYGRFDSDELSFNAKVGINTTVPNGQFEVSANSNTAFPHVLLSESDVDDYARLRFQNSSADNNFWDVAGRPKLDENEAGASLNFYYNNPALNVLRLYGDGDATLAGNLTEMSDRRLKKNLVPLNEVLPLINQINGYRYEWIHSKDTHSQIGLIAQEVIDVFPDLIKTDHEGMMSVNYTKFVPILLEGLKEQGEIIDTQQESIIEIQKRNIALMSRLTSVEDELEVIKRILIEREE